jgi:hypothetical protein
MRELLIQVGGFERLLAVRMRVRRINRTFGL